MRARTLLRLGLRLLVGVGVLAAVLRMVGAGDPARLIHRVGQAGWWLALVPVPTLVAMSLDVVGWQALLRLLGHPVAWLRLLAVRLSVEAVVLAAPGGSVAGEPLKASLLRSRLGVPLRAGAASLVLTKALVTASASIYLGLAALLASTRDTAGTPARVAAAISALLLVLSTSLLLVLHRLAVAPPRGEGTHRWRRWYERRRAELAGVAGEAKVFYRAGPRGWLLCFIPFLFEWFTEGCESFLILRCLSVSISLGDALVVDGVGSVLRAFAFFVPGGLGVQDGAQVLLLRLLGFGGDPLTAAAFVFTKRTKELFWIVTGGILFAGTRDGMAAHATQRANPADTIIAGPSPREAS